MKTIQINGTIIPNDYKDVYEWLGIEHFCPNMLELPENNLEEIKIQINSPGGDVYSGSAIYTALKQYKGKKTVVVTGLAASMGSVIAMAGDIIKMSPTAQMMIHNVSTFAAGDKNIMSHQAEVLSGYDVTISNAYRLKTKLSQSELLDLMNSEKWLTPQEAVKLGFADEILFDDQEAPVLVANVQNAVFIPPEKINKLRKEAKMDENKISTTEEALKVDETKEEVLQDTVEETSTEEIIDNKVDEVEEEKTAEAPEEAPEEEKEQPEEEKQAKEVKTFEDVIESKPRVNKFVDEAKGKNLKTIEGVSKMETTYRDAFLNAVMGKELSAEETSLIQMNNAYTHDTTNTAMVIPQTTLEQIWARATEGYGVLEDVKKMTVKGELRLVKHTGIEAGDANWYLEATPTEDEKNKFEDLILKGYDLSKAITVSKRLLAMSIDQFEDYLISELGQRISVALGTAVTQGTGTNQPKGIVTTLVADKAQVANVAKSGEITYKDFLAAIAKVHSSYKNGAAIYANSSVIWSKLAGIVDNTGRPFFVPDASQNGVGKALGFIVKEDASLKDDEILIGNAQAGYILNVNEEMSIETEAHAKARTVDFVAYMVADGAVVDNKAFALLKTTAAV